MFYASILFFHFFFSPMAEAGCFSAGLAFCGVRGGLSVLPPTACLAVNSPPRAGQARFALMMCDGSRETAEEAALRRGGGRGTKGLYVRPSKALEVGGGFYVPGLEGYRLRVAIVGLVFTLLTLNRLLLPGFKPQTTQVRALAMPSQYTALRLPLRLVFLARYRTLLPDAHVDLWRWCATFLFGHVIRESRVDVCVFC